MIEKTLKWIAFILLVGAVIAAIVAIFVISPEQLGDGARAAWDNTWRFVGAAWDSADNSG